jgi:hypothetical protein
VREAEAIAQHTKALQHLTTVAAMEGKAPIAHDSSEAAATVSPAAAREATVHSFIARHVKHTKRRRHHSSRKHTGSVSVPPPIEKDPAAKEWDRLMGTAITVHKGATAQKKAKAATKQHRSRKALVAVTLPIRVVRVLFRASAASQSFADPPPPVLLWCAVYCTYDRIGVQADDDFSLPGHSSTTLSTRTGNAGRRHRAPPHASTAAPTLPLDLADDDFVKKPPSKPPSATPKKKYKRTTAHSRTKESEHEEAHHPGHVLADNTLQHPAPGPLTPHMLYNARELKEAGRFTAQDLKEVGFTAQELRQAGFTAAELEAVGF